MCKHVKHAVNCCCCCCAYHHIVGKRNTGVQNTRRINVFITTRVSPACTAVAGTGHSARACGPLPTRRARPNGGSRARRAMHWLQWTGITARTIYSTTYLTSSGRTRSTAAAAAIESAIPGTWYAIAQKCSATLRGLLLWLSVPVLNVTLK